MIWRKQSLWYTEALHVGIEWGIVQYESTQHSTCPSCQITLSRHDFFVNTKGHFTKNTEFQVGNSHSKQGLRIVEWQFKNHTVLPSSGNQPGSMSFKKYIWGNTRYTHTLISWVSLINKRPCNLYQVTTKLSSFRFWLAVTVKGS